MSHDARSTGGPALSVVIATYNRAHLVGDVVAALLAQAVPAGLRWEIVVVDNNSSDATRATLKALALEARVPIRYVFEPRQGKSHALNTGVRTARGEILAFTDDDALPTRRWVAVAASVLDKWGADGAGGRILPRWESDPPPVWVVESKRLRDRLALMTFNRATALALPLRGHPQAWGPNLVFRRSMVLSLGGFDPARGVRGTKRYCGEDVEFVERALRAGRRVMYDPRLVVHHRVPRARLRRSYFRRIEWEAGEGLALHGDCPARAWILRQTAVRALGWAWSAARLRLDRFEAELAFLHAVGMLCGTIRYRPRGRSTVHPALDALEGSSDFPC